MNDIADLYQELIIDHSSRPRNFRPIGGAASSAEGYNPLCGDKVKVYQQMDGDVVADASFLGDGCAISKASASLMTESIKGKTRAEVEKARTIPIPAGWVSWPHFRVCASFPRESSAARSPGTRFARR